MLTAKDAAIKSVEVIQQHKTKELKKIDYLIQDAVSNGERKINIDGTISEISKLELERLGYKVTRGSQYNECYVIIGW